MNGFFIILGIVLVIGGFYWVSRCFQPEENNRKTDDDERLIHVGLGEYQTENLVAFRAILAILFGVVFILIGLKI